MCTLYCLSGIEDEINTFIKAGYYVSLYLGFIHRCRPHTTRAVHTHCTLCFCYEECTSSEHDEINISVSDGKLLQVISLFMTFHPFSLFHTAEIARRSLATAYTYIIGLHYNHRVSVNVNDTVINTNCLYIVVFASLGNSQPNPNGIFLLYIVRVEACQSNSRRENTRGLTGDGGSAFPQRSARWQTY